MPILATDDSFFAEELTATELVARLLDEERRAPTPPRSSGFSMVVVDS
jgi:hypothetical protein